MSFIRKHTNLLFVLILPVYLYIVQTSIQNKHTHVYANGIVVTHSHPGCNGDAPTNNHNHSQREICLYASLHLDLYETAEFLEFDFEVPVVHTDYFVYDEQAETVSVIYNTIPRAPPV
ncbi:hypothetical protein SLH46_02970 [Draconibacterium sp. IB214405]|uniref:hypothetical protein n=1 Tax=Draconibacterium sp. IB214405 TaxID=3097352 RepID=UPI002A106D27|nr:hypothetical protein [Draconibacterium sp. IB214405]MDX8338129.1 hypothetical protein [Draconibacterium sp. IB214405]